MLARSVGIMQRSCPYSIESQTKLPKHGLNGRKLRRVGKNTWLCGEIRSNSGFLMKNGGSRVFLHLMLSDDLMNRMGRRRLMCFSREMRSKPKSSSLSCTKLLLIGRTYIVRGCGGASSRVLSQLRLGSFHCMKAKIFPGKLS